MVATYSSGGSELSWWEEQFFPRPSHVDAKRATEEVGFRDEFFPALLRVCEAQELPPELSLDELRVLVCFCLGDAARDENVVTKKDFRRFLARFGPLEQSIQKLVANFCVNREMAPWFHGTMSRSEVERVLTARELDDGAFLVRFSESQPSKFVLSYLKVHETDGRREVKNCLVENMGHRVGYALLQGGHSQQRRLYSSLQRCVQHNAWRLKYGVPSELARMCNNELGDLRATCDHQSDAYAAFSSDTVVDAQENETQGPGADYTASMLFTRSPVLRPSSVLPLLRTHQLPPRESGESSTQSSDNYGCFALDALSPIPSDSSNEMTSSGSLECQNPQVAAHEESDYGNFADFAEQAANSKNAFFPAPGSPPFSQAPDGYASFVAFVASSAFPADESRELAARQAQFVSLSRSPTREKASVWGDGSQQDRDDVYGSFASTNVTSVSAPMVPVTVKAPASSSLDANSSGDYGNFAGMAANDYPDASSSELSPQSDLPEWDSTLGPPPSPPRSILLRQSPPAVHGTGDVYGSFSSLTITHHRVSSSDSDHMLPSTASLPNLSTGDDMLVCLSGNSDLTVDKDESDDTVSDFSASTPSLQRPHSPRGSALEELNAGMAFYKQKQLDEAILRFVVARETARETGDKVVEARALGNLGTVYLDRQSAKQAVECYEKCLEITRSIGDTKRERTILNNLVLAFVACEEFAEALGYCQVQLEMTSNDINRRKILSRMSLLRERMARAAAAKRATEASAAFA